MNGLGKTIDGYLDDHSRVKLSSDDREGRGNYINANYVDVNIRLMEKQKRDLIFI